MEPRLRYPARVLHSSDPSNPLTAPPFEELELDPRLKPTVRHRRRGFIPKGSSFRAAVTWLKNADEDLVGLAISGGGIRSATFNLGLLQALSELCPIDALDYISTVSGGGHTGGFRSA